MPRMRKVNPEQEPIQELKAVKKPNAFDCRFELNSINRYLDQTDKHLIDSFEEIKTRQNEQIDLIRRMIQTINLLNEELESLKNQMSKTD